MYVIYSGHISQLKHVCDTFWLYKSTKTPEYITYMFQLTYMTRMYHMHVLVDLYDQNASHTCFS
jgi:hypothetical protein